MGVSTNNAQAMPVLTAAGPPSCPPGLATPLLGALLLSASLIGLAVGLLAGRRDLRGMPWRRALPGAPSGRLGRRVDVDYFETLQRLDDPPKNG